ncbi:4,5-DOPA dioxygenase extradiol [Methylococcus sp. EFPC2]|uniref:4,5-DOPA-extradiol-dioxygenase n=1 Tax=Methylococcus sp. EFPC2 TaxID=2812648 RepID=UPI0019689BC8|nr:4,5-DOPA dioxygenase extradiol [Methylococcus sp. EFPC2]QSA98761.1 4,5-DOPA dioxygenase extradiol [Methylococcus sp. EFPC2]
MTYPLVSTDFSAPSGKMPALFIGHGSPMNAIEDTEFSRTWAEIGRSLPRPEAILCISAHWETDGTRITAMDGPRTIHDFYGFPKPLYEVQYPAAGNPDLARWITGHVDCTRIADDFDWGLDHGAWSVLCRLFPEADIPVVQLSLDRTQPPAFHYQLGRALRALRTRGVLIIGSGNIVHNLGTLVWKDVAHDWALAFDEHIRGLIVTGDHDAIVHYQRLGDTARKSVPTNEHFLPLLYILALQDEHEKIGFYTEKVTLGSISMRSLILPGA